MILARCAAIAAIACTASFNAWAQDRYPSKPVRVVIGSAAGSTQELEMRTIAESFQKAMGQPLVIENRPGAGGIIAAESVYKAPPDGYTILLGNVGQISVNQYTFPKLPYDAREMVPITEVSADQYVFVVHPSVPAKNVAEFVAYAKANPGKVTFASSQLGSPGHLAGVMLNTAAGIDMLHVAYKGVPAAVNDLLAGRVNGLFATFEASRELIRAGKLRALAVTSEKRIEAAPDIPTFTESGYPSVVVYIWVGLMAPPKTPQPIADRLSAELRKLLGEPEVQARMRKANKTPVLSTPAEFAQFLKEDRARWEAAVKASGFKME